MGLLLCRRVSLEGENEEQFKLSHHLPAPVAGSVEVRGGWIAKASSEMPCHGDSNGVKKSAFAQ